MIFTLEVIGFNIEACLLAQTAGANRIELCDNPADGGTTPSYGFLKTAREKLHIDLFPIIRPRGGDFFYTADEFEVMKTDIKLCKQLGCEGAVIGLLNPDGSIDRERTKQLVELAYPMEVTFHRAFDRVNDAFHALEDIIDTGCNRILTSGLHPTALEGSNIIADLIIQANNRILLMPGSGIRADNIIEIANKTGAAEFHSSARMKASSKMEYTNTAMKENLEVVTVDTNEIKAMISSLNKYFNAEK